MICKGTQHGNGVKLAAYLTTGKNGERAELWQLCGFAAKDIRDAFRDVHVMAEATKCEQPFMHVQVRNREGETLTRQEWERVASRIESKLGLTGQPRAIAFHTNEKTGHEHMHVAWSRIDEEALKARPLPFFKFRLKEAARELEATLGLEPVRNERDGPIKYAPTRAQEEQSRRLDIDIHELRGIIRDCWDRSDDGRSFQAALTDRGLTLAQGQRRDFLVIDGQGGMHALGKRILGATAAQTRSRMSDLDRESLPTVEQAREQIRDRDAGRRDRKVEPINHDRNLWREITDRAGTGKEVRLPIERVPNRIPAREPFAAVGTERGQGARSYAETRRAKTGLRTPGGMLGKTVDAFASAFESLFAPIATPEQQREGAEAMREREIQAEKTINLSRFLAERRQEREQQQTREADGHRERERTGREL